MPNVREIYATLRRQRHPARFLTGLVLLRSGACRHFVMTRDGVKLRFYPSSMSMLCWADPEARAEDHDFFRDVLRPGDVVVDVGANVGSHTLHLARLVGDAGHVIACEPTAWAFAKLKANLALNPAVSARVTPVQAMLVREGAATEAAVYSSWPLADAGGVHELHRGRAMSTEGASADTFDALVDRLALPRVDVVKLDVDGHEHHVLAGAARVLARHQPLLVLELAPYAFDGGPPGFDEMIGVLASAGYSLTEVRSRRPLPVDGPALRALIAPGTAHNAVATPKSAKIARSNAG